MNSIRYFQIALKMRDKTLENIVKLSDFEDDLIQAKTEFNAMNKIQIALLKTHPKRINFIVRTNVDFDYASIVGYLEILIKEMHWSQYSIKSEKSFDLVFSKELTANECFSYLNNVDSIDNISLNKWAELDDYKLNDNSDDQYYEYENNHGNERQKRGRVPLNNLIEEINELVGHVELKKELLGWIDLSQKYTQSRSKNIVIPYKYILVASPGSGITTALKVMSEVLYGLRITLKPGFSESLIDHEETRPFFSGRDSRSIVNGYIISEYNNIVELDEKRFNSDESTTVFIIDPDQDDHQKILEKVNSLYNCKQIVLGDFSEEELLQIFERNLKKYGFELSDSAKIEFNQDIKDQKNVKRVMDIVSRIIMAEIGDPTNLGKDNIIIENLDIAKLYDTKGLDEIILEEISGLEELDSLIGLEDIKSQVMDIINQITINRRRVEKGILNKEKMHTMHMNFYGNPGTGKTTVARILGRILKEQGILKKGDFFEVGRKDLVAIYVGHTAIKTSAVLNKALDSVLFIDEAYSLNGHHKEDYGMEALDTIISHMENYRDRSIIIFAGYKNEMDELFNLNPGLKSRVPFKVEFRDYDENELSEIFEFITKDKYYFNEDVKNELQRFFQKAIEYYKDEFSNGRFVRNVFERIVLKQSARLIKENTLDKESLMEIKVEDIFQVYEEDEYKKINEFDSNKKTFGFSA